MRHFIIASHGPLSAAILKSASLIAGEDILRRFACIQVAMEDSGDRIRQICEGLFAGWEAEDEGIALTDVIGGNVANILMEYTGSRKLHIVVGMNLGMVLEAGFSEETTPAENLAQSLAAMGQAGIRYLNAAMDEGREEDEI